MNQANLDLKDSPADEAKLQPEFITIDMPEVKDISGQENVHSPKMNQFADTTASSDDEEGKGILDSLNEPEGSDDDGELIAGDDAEIPEDKDDDDEVPHDEDEEIDNSNVSDEEKDLLESAANSLSDEDDLNMDGKGLDDKDEDGDPLEEKSFQDDVTGSDLDVPGSEEDDADEKVGDEDEENNAYSGDDKNRT